MSTRETDELREDDGLGPVARDASALLAERVAAARPVPDFAAMLARARELDAGAVPADAVDRAEALAPVIPLARGADGADDAAALEPFTEALREQIEARLAERRMAGIPPAPVPARRRGALGVVLGVCVAAAAALVLAFFGPRLLGGEVRQDRGVAANADGAGAEPREARRAEGPEAHVRRVVERPAPAPVPAASPEAAAEDVPADSSRAGSDVPADSSAAAPGPVAAREDRRGGSRRRPAAAPAEAPAEATAEGPVLSLEDEAQALWQRGELAAAELKYREILKVAGDSLRAELAYGDLFALARQIRGAEGQVAVWREYLARFPAGRFADDARAGVCQRSPADARAGCWADYLERHPAGSHRKQAEAALAASGGAESP